MYQQWVLDNIIIILLLLSGIRSSTLLLLSVDYIEICPPIIEQFGCCDVGISCCLQFFYPFTDRLFKRHAILASFTVAITIAITVIISLKVTQHHWNQKTLADQIERFLIQMLVFIHSLLENTYNIIKSLERRRRRKITLLYYLGQIGMDERRLWSGWIGNWWRGLPSLVQLDHLRNSSRIEGHRIRTKPTYLNGF